MMYLEISYLVTCAMGKAGKKEKRYRLAFMMPEGLPKAHFLPGKLPAFAKK